MDSSGPWVLWMLTIVVASVLMLIGVEDRQTARRRRVVWRKVANAMRIAFCSDVRAYFAPLHIAPWRAAWRAYRDPAGRWWSPLAAWLEAVEPIASGPAQSSKRDGEGDGPQG